MDILICVVLWSSFMALEIVILLPSPIWLLWYDDITCYDMGYQVCDPYDGTLKQFWVALERANNVGDLDDWEIISWTIVKKLNKKVTIPLAARSDTWQKEQLDRCHLPGELRRHKPEIHRNSLRSAGSSPRSPWYDDDDGGGWLVGMIICVEIIFFYFGGFDSDREIIRGRDKRLWFVIDVRKDQAGVNCFRSEPHKSTDRFVDTDLVFQQIYFIPMSCLIDPFVCFSH